MIVVWLKIRATFSGNNGSIIGMFVHILCAPTPIFYCVCDINSHLVLFSPFFYPIIFWLVLSYFRALTQLKILPYLNQLPTNIDVSFLIKQYISIWLKGIRSGISGDMPEEHLPFWLLNYGRWATLAFCVQDSNSECHVNN